jgi:hypothetical protein
MHEVFDFPSVEFLLGDTGNSASSHRNRRNVMAQSELSLPDIDSPSHQLGSQAVSDAFCGRSVHRTNAQRASSEAPCWKRHAIHLGEQACCRDKVQDFRGMRLPYRDTPAASMTEFRFGQALQNAGSNATSLRPAATGDAEPRPQGSSDATSGKECEDLHNSEESSFKGVGALAHALVSQCGSLERAFTTFDYNHKGKITRSQWETGLALLRLDCESLSGISSRALFKMMDKLEVTLDAWTAFFKQLEGTAAAKLLTEDFGPLEALRKSRSCTMVKMFDVPETMKSSNDNVRRVKRHHSVSSACTHATSDLLADESDEGTFARSDVRRNSAAAVLSGGHRHLITDTDDDCPAVANTDSIGDTLGMEVPKDTIVESHGLAKRARPRGNLNRQASKASAGSTSVTSVGDDDTHAGNLVDETCDSSAHMCKAHVEHLVTKKSNDLRECSNDELDALAEQQQLFDELASLRVDGVKALAYVIIAKLKTFKNAFKWFDMNSTGKIVQVTWDTGLHLLRIDVERLTGLYSKDIFEMMDVDPRDGCITWKKWQRFFDVVDNDELRDLLQKARGPGRHCSLADRCFAKKHELRQLQARQLQDAKTANAAHTLDLSRENDAHLLHVSTDAQVPIDGVSFDDNCGGRWRQRSKRRALSMDGLAGHDGAVCAMNESVLGDGNRSDGDISLHRSTGQGDRSDQGDGSDDPDNCRARSGSKRSSLEGESDIDEADGAGGYEQAYRQRIRLELSRLALGDSQEYAVGIDSLECSIIQEVAEEMGFWSNAAEELQGPLSVRGGSEHKDSDECLGAVLVSNLSDFVRQTREQLQAMQPGEHMEFPSSLSETMRRIVHIQAAELGIWTHSEGKGTQRRVVAFNLGEFASEIRMQLEALGPGQNKCFSGDLSIAQQRLVRLVACEFGYWVESPRTDNGSCFDVFNFRDFAEGVRTQLVALEAGHQHNFPNDLLEPQCRLIHSIAGELGLISASIGEGSDRCVAVAQLSDFCGQVRQMLKRLQSGQRRDFPTSLTMLQRKVVKDCSLEVECVFAVHESVDCRWVSVTRPGRPQGTQYAEPITAPHKREPLSDPSSKSLMLDVKEKAKEKAKDVPALQVSNDGEYEKSVISKIFLACNWMAQWRVYLSSFPRLE